MKIKSHDELRTLSDAFRMMLVEIDLNNFEQKELAVREQKLEIELQLANELNSSMLPKELPRREQGYEFAVRGLLCSGREVEYDFYDYFMLDQDRLCVIIGAVPGEGIPQALYTVMAQTAIKSQLRSGLPLAAAMTAANSQLHEMSGTFVLHALVGGAGRHDGEIFLHQRRTGGPPADAEPGPVRVGPGPTLRSAGTE